MYNCKVYFIQNLCISFVPVKLFFGGGRHGGSTRALPVRRSAHHERAVVVLDHLRAMPTLDMTAGSYAHAEAPVHTASPITPLSYNLSSFFSFAEEIDPHVDEVDADGALLADLCVDSDLDTACSTNWGICGDHWLSLQMPAGTPVHDVVLYNRRDVSFLRPYFGTIEVFLGPVAGATDVARGDVTLCGSVTFDKTQEPEPYVVSCGGEKKYEWVTARQARKQLKEHTHPEQGCQLSLAEMRVYSEHAGPLPLPPKPSPSPAPLEAAALETPHDEL